MTRQNTLLKVLKKTIKFTFIIGLRTPLRILRTIDDIFTGLYLKVTPSPYTITGACKKRGVCCNKIAIQLHPKQYPHTILRKTAILWYENIYNFEHIANANEHNALIFRCNYLKNNQCSIYSRRPLICRRYPLPPKQFIKPQFLPGCGFKLQTKSDI